MFRYQVNYERPERYWNGVVRGTRLVEALKVLELAENKVQRNIEHFGRARQSLLAAKQKYDEAQALVASIRGEISSLRVWKLIGLEKSSISQFRSYR